MEAYSADTMGGRTSQVHLDEHEDYLIVYRKEERPKGFDSVDISFRNHIIRIYDDRPWKIHHMNSDSQTIAFPVLQQS